MKKSHVEALVAGAAVASGVVVMAVWKRISHGSLGALAVGGLPSAMASASEATHNANAAQASRALAADEAYQQGVADASILDATLVAWLNSGGKFGDPRKLEAWTSASVSHVAHNKDWKTRGFGAQYENGAHDQSERDRSAVVAAQNG